ncbi:RecQ family ATP-dependent DNA helicase [Muribaculaceae bacterium Isolate-013 (NCI)]|nr:RecQ family ATP-dependent DNA helicase [Muribaculaceae bacterium Isolate-013 (NCI)]
MTPEEILKNYWGYTAFRPMQREIISSVLEGNDTLGLLPTGGGKSITFQVPALALDGVTLVVTPLISLMKDQVDNLRDIGVKAYDLHSALTRRETRRALDSCAAGRAKILYLSPEKLQVKSFHNELRRLPVKLIVVDEAHCISQWGYDFRPSYMRIAEVRRMFPQAPVLALTASATAEVIDDIMTRLGFHRRDKVFRRSFSRSNISYVARYCDFKQEQLVHILSRVPGTAIVYTRSRKRTRELSDFLRKEGVPADFYHAGLSSEDKAGKQNRWKSGQTRVIVATNAFGMGIDKPDVRLVIHYDLPSSLEEYYQESGRAGRDGLESYAVVLASPADKGVLSRRLSEAFPPKDYIRQVYDMACVYLSVGMGEGQERLFEFNSEEFARRFHLKEGQALAALRLLGRSGYINYIEETATRSRLMMVMERHELYGLRLEPATDELLQLILRTYPGIFADYEFISESLLAYRLGVTEQSVYEGLIQLGRLHVIHYVPRSVTPYIFFPIGRQPSGDVVLPREVYEQRREQMRLRIEAMKEFVFSTSGCRVLTMLRYFNEENGCECGKCDVCRAARRVAPPRRQVREREQNLDESILYILRKAPAEGVAIDYISAQTGASAKEVAARARLLADALKVEILSGARLRLLPE